MWRHAQVYLQVLRLNIRAKCFLKLLKERLLPGHRRKTFDIFRRPLETGRKHLKCVGKDEHEGTL